MNFSDYFGIAHRTVIDYGAFDISLDSDLPLFIDPFLLFNSTKQDYRNLHDQILKYLTFLRDKAIDGSVDDGLMQSWYTFKEVRQNWLGFTLLGNGGHGLGQEFGESLLRNLGRLFEDQPAAVTAGRHLEKISLIRGGVGRDSISDFTTNLIKDYLLQYTQTFAQAHIKAKHRKKVRVRRVAFNYRTESWIDGTYELPVVADDDFVLLTPEDLLTRDDTWINRSDMIRGFWAIPEAIEDSALRAQVANYFDNELRKRPVPKRAPTKADVVAAVDATIEAFPVVLDYYIALKEVDGERAKAVSQEYVDTTRAIFYALLRELLTDLWGLPGFYRGPVTSYQEALEKAKAFKQYVENQDGYQLINRGREELAEEKDVQLFFGLAFVGSTFDVNR